MDYFFFFIFIPFLLGFMYILPANIKNHFILLPSNPTILSVFFSNYVHQDLLHLLNNLLGYLSVIFLLFNYETKKRTFYISSFLIFILLPFVSSFLIIYRFPNLPPAMGFSAIVAGFIGYLIFPVFRYVKKFYYEKSNYYLIFLILIINLVFVIFNLHASLHFKIFTLVLLAILLILNRIVIYEVGKQIIQIFKNSLIFNNFHDIGNFIYYFSLFALSIIFLFFLPNLIPSQVIVGNNIINTPSHYIGYIFGLFISIIVGNIKFFYERYILPEPRILRIRKERIKVIIRCSLKREKYYLLLLIISLLLFLFISIQNNNIIYSFVFYFLAIFSLYKWYSNIKFYVSYYSTWEIVEKIQNPIDEKEKEILFENFQIEYDMFRKNIKKHIRSTSRGNLLTNDYEINRIIQAIDTFFDATIKILFRRNVMTIPFSPHDSYQIFMEEIERQEQLSDYTEEDYNEEVVPTEYDFVTWEIDKIDFNTINIFLNYFGTVVIRKPKKNLVNTVAIGELFRKWNFIIEKLEKSMFMESKNLVEKFYDEKRDKRNLLYKTLLEILFIFVLTILSTLFTQFLFWPKNLQ